MFEGIDLIRGRVTVKCHAWRVKILFLVNHYRCWKRRRDNHFKALLDGWKIVAELDLKVWVD